MSHISPPNPYPVPRDEHQADALAWAEFLYDEYILNKHKQLLLDGQDSKMESNKGVTSD